ncbi:MAG: isoprenylcysteine carboxylmethyltransferase family protein [Candidatus Solibacter usitatus]|nr:isoprenylcysteine carboxylmethyltransferase family protein [Candidatus Solibacter usitatus]
MMRFPKSYADRVQRLRVPGGFVILAAFIFLSRPSYDSYFWGIPVSLFGLWIRAWAAGHLAKNETLAQSGPYSLVRNPLYLGSLFMAGGVVISSHSWPLAAVFTSAFLLIYLPVIQLEEEHLRKLFPAYASYADRVPSLLPRFGPADSGAGFRAELYWRNQEWRAVLGYLFAAVLLLAKLVI